MYEWWYGVVRVLAWSMNCSMISFHYYTQFSKNFQTCQLLWERRLYTSTSRTRVSLVSLVWIAPILLFSVLIKSCSSRILATSSWLLCFLSPNQITVLFPCMILFTKVCSLDNGIHTYHSATANERLLENPEALGRTLRLRIASLHAWWIG